MNSTLIIFSYGIFMYSYLSSNLFVAPQPPTLYPYNGGTTVNEGTEKTLRCIAKASPKANITWYRHGKELQNTTSCSPSDEKECKTVYETYEDDPTSALHTTFTKQVLQIHGAMYPRDQGEFKCIAMNGIGQPVELIIDLDILGMCSTFICSLFHSLLLNFFFQQPPCKALCSICFKCTI